MIEFKVGVHNYRAKQMDARKQFHVARRMAGAAGTGTISSFLTAIAEQSDEVFDYVIDACLGVVERQDPGSQSWAPVLGPSGVLMYSDIMESLAVTVQIVVPVVEANVKGFLSALPSDFIPGLVAQAMASKPN